MTMTFLQPNIEIGQSAAAEASDGASIR